MSTPVIVAEGLTRRFWLRTVLDGLDLTVPAGSIYGLVGPNGAGKSTTVRLLLRMLRPSGGEARVLGTPVGRLGPRELARIGYVAADQDLPRWMRGRDLLAFLRPLYPTWDDGLCQRLVARFDVPLDRAIAKLSRGQRVRLAVIAATAFRPRLLILDEPFGGLDAVARDDVGDAMLEAAGDDGWSVLLASHDLEMVERMADRVALLNAGCLLLDEPTERLLGRFPPPLDHRAGGRPGPVRGAAIVDRGRACRPRARCRGDRSRRRCCRRVRRRQQLRADTDPPHVLARDLRRPRRAEAW